MHKNQKNRRQVCETFEQHCARIGSIATDLAKKIVWSETREYSDQMIISAELVGESVGV